eukprot:GHVU01097309.1.p3 GENE.GHVU01097309.1~~GHVU01097309.1.p3  ORF type:complete len:126 (-),score=3.97 GHVU01097309.1:5039-5416(-)
MVFRKGYEQRLRCNSFNLPRLGALVTISTIQTLLSWFRCCYWQSLIILESSSHARDDMGRWHVAENKNEYFPLSDSFNRRFSVFLFPLSALLNATSILLWNNTSARLHIEPSRSRPEAVLLKGVL